MRNSIEEVEEEGINAWKLSNTTKDKMAKIYYKNNNKNIIT